MVCEDEVSVRWMMVVVVRVWWRRWRSVSVAVMMDGMMMTTMRNDDAVCDDAMMR